MLYKVELKTKVSPEVDNRYPTIEEIKDSLDGYIERGQGIVSLHRSLYDYKWDTQLTDYHKVDSVETVGHITNAHIEELNGTKKIFLLVDFNEAFHPDKNYICFCRMTMQSDPTKSDRRFHVTNLFVVDLVVILDSEKTDAMELSTIQLVEGLTEEWWKI